MDVQIKVSLMDRIYIWQSLINSLTTKGNSVILLLDIHSFMTNHYLNTDTAHD